MDKCRNKLTNSGMHQSPINGTNQVREIDQCDTKAKRQQKYIGPKKKKASNN
jgi:hypothetical protein